MWDRHEIVDLLREAGAIAMHYYADPPRRVKADGSLVTRADVEIEALLRRRLEAPAAGRFLLGEEGIDELTEDYLAAALERTLFVVDPIDGTAPYAHHLPTWGISIGCAHAGRLTDGAIYLPVLQEVAISAGGCVYWLDLAQWDGQTAYPFAPIDVLPPAYSPTGLISLTQSLTKRGTVALPNPVQTVSCAVISLAYLLPGRYCAYIGDLKLWDLAGGLPLLLQAGLAASPLDGSAELDGRISADYFFLDPDHPRRWKTRQPIIYAAPATVPAMRPAIRMS